jgi:acetyl esterase/lipase
MRYFMILLSLLTFQGLSLPIPQQAPAPIAATRCTTPAQSGTVSSPQRAANIAYATHKGAAPNATALDIYHVSDRATVRPVLIFVHGGGWTAGDKRNQARKPAAFVSAGYVYISVNYRLVPSVQFPDNAQDVADAVAWVAQNIGQYGGDPNCIALMGHSAGAHLATLIASDPRYLQKHGLRLTTLKAVISLDTPTIYLDQVIPADGKYSGNNDDPYREAFGDDPAVWQAATPARYIRAGSSYPPFLIIYVANRANSKQSALDFVTLLKSNGYAGQSFAAVGKTHVSLNQALGEAGDASTAQILAFLGEVMG